MGIRAIGIQTQCVPITRNRLGQVALLLKGQAQQVERMGMRRIGLEDLPIKLFRRLKPAGLVMLDGAGQCFGNRWHSGNYKRAVEAKTRAARSKISMNRPVFCPNQKKRPGY